MSSAKIVSDFQVMCSLIERLVVLLSPVVQGRALYMYERVTKKYDIYRNNNKKKKKPSYFGKFETVGTKKNFYEVNFFHSLIKLNSSLI